MVARIATFPFQATLISENARIQQNLAKTQLQISSGLRSDNYKGIGSSSQLLLSYETQYSKLKSYTDNINVGISRLESMFSVLGNMNGTIQQFLGGLSAAMSGLSSTADLQALAQIGQEAVVSLLNSNIGGRYLFGGSIINHPPVDLTDPGYIAQTPPSVADTTYYQGDNIVESIQLDDNFVVSYGIQADNTAFEQILRGYNLILNNPGSVVAMQEAFGLINAGVDLVATLQNNVSNAANLIEDQQGENLADLNTIENLVSQLKDTDLSVASVLMAEYETQLEASYSTMTRSLRLNLHDFL
ncbi:MAG: hypothetical protein GC136_02005 [Alphaproteobacteria bacterium]|nr:hypothetical protein [Alphaproteobacteria bacterium]